MIRTKADLTAYLKADRRALNNPRGLAWLTHDTWRFQRALRRFEYHYNTRPRSIRRVIAHLRWRRQGRRLGFTIPPNVFGPGLSIAHYGTIVVNGGARVGANCRLHTSTNIGTAAGGHAEAPVVGDNAYIAPGAKLFGPIVLGDNVKVGANAVVNKSHPEGNCSLLGVPAKAFPLREAAQV